MKYLDYDGLSYLWGKIKNLIDSYITKDSSGNIAAVGTITVQGHDSAIGYHPDQGYASVNIATGTSWRVPASAPTLTLSPGTWLIFAQAEFPGNTSGDRGIGITYNSTTGNVAHSRHTQRAGSYASLADVISAEAMVVLTAARTYQIEIFQNSGSTLSSVGFRINAVRIA